MQSRVQLARALRSVCERRSAGLARKNPLDFQKAPTPRWFMGPLATRVYELNGPSQYFWSIPGSCELSKREIKMRRWTRGQMQARRGKKIVEWNELKYTRGCRNCISDRRRPPSRPSAEDTNPWKWTRCQLMVSAVIKSYLNTISGNVFRLLSLNFKPMKNL